MDDRQWDLSRIPFGNVLAGADFSCRREPLLNTLQVMLEPVGHQQRFAVRAFDQILQCIQLPVVNLHGILFLGVHSTVGHLTQFSGQGSGVHRVDFLAFDLDDQLFLHLVIHLLLVLAHADQYAIHNALRHLQVIRRPHGNGDVSDLSIDFILSTRPGFIGEDLLHAALVGNKVGFAVPGDKPSEPLAHVQEPELCPQIHQTVAAGCTRQAYDVFECIDVHVIKTIAQSLKNGSLDYDTFDRIITQRMNAIWYSQYKAEYELLSSCIAFFRLLERPIPTELLATEYVQKYTEIYWQVDYHYRHFCMSLRAVEHPLDEFEFLADRVEMTYQYKFLDVIGKEFSDALARQGEWRFSGIKPTSTFYQDVQRNNYKKCFVIISDGFRYEVAHELFDRIQRDSVLKGTETLSCAISPLPSETRFGMASLLPHQSLTYQQGDVLVDAKPTNGTQPRDAILKSKKTSYAAIQYEEITNMSRSELRTYMADKSLVYIYHNVIDNAGEHNERRVLDVAETAIQELLDLIKKLYNNLQISNFYITADHGFIFRRNTVMESDKYGGIVGLHPTETNKRYVITDDPSMSIPYTLEFPLSGDQEGYRVILPYSYDLFKTQGSGLQYIHGGASLQEIVVPIIHIGELRAAKNKDAVTPVGVRLKSVTRKVTNRSFALEFEQTEKAEGTKQAISCETYMVDEDGNKVSGTYPFVAASTSDDPQARVTSIRFTLMNIQFDRNKRYYLILRNTEKQNEYIEREQFVIDILGFRVF